MFPGPHSTIHRNEAGEPIGWSNETDYEPGQEELERQWEKNHCIDCGALHNECVCDKICDSCGEPTLDDDGLCANDDCPSNETSLLAIPDCPRNCGELIHSGPCNPEEQGD